MVDLHEQMSVLPWEKPRSSHWIAASVAVLVSLVFHTAVVQFFPAVPVGRTAQLDADARRLPPLVLRDVRRETISVGERPQRFESPDQALAAVPLLDADGLRELVEEWAPAPVTEITAAVRGEEAAARPPLEVPVRDVWDVRQDVLEIRDRIVPDEIAALPRRVIPDIDRVARAPDITAAAESHRLLSVSRGAEWLESRAAVSTGGAPASVPYLDDEPAEAPPKEARTPTMDRSDPLAEGHSDVSDTEAIEALLQFRMYMYWDPSDPDHQYFQLQIERAGDDVLPVLPRDVLLIQDASASMTQRTIDQCRVGLRVWLDSLRPEDRFDIIAFRDDVSRAMGDLLPATPRNILRAQTFIETLRARSGTDVFASLAPLLDIERVDGRPVIALLVSDGIPTVGMLNSTMILQEFSQQNAGEVAVFTVGGGPQVNEYLLDFLSFQNRGDSIMTWDRDDLPNALMRFAQELNRPVLTDLQHQVAGGEGIDLFPRLLPHLFLDRPLTLYGRKPLETESMVLRILGRSGSERKDMVFSIPFTEGREGSSTIRTEWAWQKVYSLIGEHIQTRDPDTLLRIRGLAAAFGLNVLYGDDLVPTTFQRRFRFHGQQAE